MPTDPNLNFNFGPVEQVALHGAIDAGLAVLNAPTVPYVNLTRDERKKTPSIGHRRLSYVNDAVNNILPAFPALSSMSIPLARTTTLFDLAVFVVTLAPKIAELNDRLTDLGINAENLVYKSMNDSYNTAQQQEGRVPGADVFIEAIAPLFADQGSNADEPPMEDPTP